MQLDAKWQPTKFVRRGGRLQASRDPDQVGIGSRLVADLIARFYNDAIPRYARGRLLDLGCGKAPLYGFYTQYADEVLRVDWDVSLHGNPHIDLAHDLNRPLPFPDNRFDTILFSDVLEHLPEPVNCWMELSRVLAPGGTVILNVPFLYWLHEEPYDFYRYTEHALRRFAETAKLDILELGPIGGAPEVLLDILGKILARYRIGKGIAKLLPPLHALLMRAAVVRRFSRGTAQKFPLSYGMVVRQPA